MVSKYGMSDELGPVVYSDDNNEVFLGKDYGHVNNYSEATSARIDEQIEKMMRKAYSQTESILKTHYDKLELVAETLIKNEKISGDQFTQLMENGFIADEKVSENEEAQAEDTEIVEIRNELRDKDRGRRKYHERKGDRRELLERACSVDLCRFVEIAVHIAQDAR